MLEVGSVVWAGVVVWIGDRLGLVRVKAQIVALVMVLELVRVVDFGCSSI